MVEFTLSEVPHSGQFVFSGDIALVEPGGTGVTHSVVNNSDSDRVIFLIGMYNNQGTVNCGVSIMPPGKTTGYGQSAVFGNIAYLGTTTESTTYIQIGAPILTSTTSGTLWCGLGTGSVLLWPAGWTLFFNVAAATARTHILTYAYWERRIQPDGRVS